MALINQESILTRLLHSNDIKLNFETMHSWHASFSEASQEFSHSMDRAMLGGILASSAGFAFIGGYQSAIEALISGIESNPLESSKQQPLSALCISEKGGNHPKAIETVLRSEDQHFFVNGQKTFVSGGCDAKQLFIAVKDQRFEQAENTQPKIKILRLRLDQDNCAGLSIKAMPDLGFLKDIKHGQLTMDGLIVSASNILESDGYNTVIKPFRTYEDLHVQAALSAYRLAIGLKSGWPEETIESYLSLLLGLKGCFNLGPTNPECHLVIAGLRSQLLALYESSDAVFADSSPELYEEWKRDSAILKVAQKAHIARTQKAWSLMSS